MLYIGNISSKWVKIILVGFVLFFGYSIYKFISVSMMVNDTMYSANQEEAKALDEFEVESNKILQGVQHKPTKSYIRDESGQLRDGVYMVDIGLSYTQIQELKGLGINLHLFGDALRRQSIIDIESDGDVILVKNGEVVVIEEFDMGLLKDRLGG